MLQDNKHFQLALGAAALVPLIWGSFWLSTGRRHRSGAPSVPYYIPWLGSAPDLAKDPDGFIDHCSRKYGEIFVAKVGGNTLHYITSPYMIPQVWRQSRAMQFRPIQVVFGQIVFNITKEGAEAWRRLAIGDITLRYLAPLNVDDVLKLYCVEVVRHMQPIFDSSGAAFTTRLNAFLNPLFFRITSRAFFGPEFPAETIYPPFMAFDKGFSQLAAGMPRIFIPKAYTARTETLRQLKEYIAAPHTACEAMDRTEQGALDAGLGPDDVAGFFLGTLWPVTANVGNAIFWTLYLLIKDGPEGLVDLQTEIDSEIAGWKAVHPGSDPFKDATTLFDFFKASKFPYFDSLIKEVMRFTSSAYSMRQVEEDGTTLIGDKGQVFTFSEGDIIVCVSRSTHLDEEVYKDAHKFIPERFMENVKHRKNGKDLPNFWIPFGGGTSICHGRHFAAAEIQIATIWLLSHFQIRLDPPSQPHVRYDVSKVGFGIIRNKDDPSVLLTKKAVKV